MQAFWNSPLNFWDGAIDVVPSAEAADARNQILGQELFLKAEKLFVKEVLAAKRRELDAWQDPRLAWCQRDTRILTCEKVSLRRREV